MQICINVPNFVLIAWTVAEIWPFSDFSKWRLSAILDFEQLKFLLPVWFGGPICVTKSNFVPIGRSFAEIWPIFDFSRWRPSAILDSFYVYLDHPQRAFVGLCHCSKFGWNRCSSFDNIPVLIFCEFGLKCLFTPLFGIWPLDEKQYQPVLQMFQLLIIAVPAVYYLCSVSYTHLTLPTIYSV